MTKNGRAGIYNFITKRGGNFIGELYSEEEKPVATDKNHQHADVPRDL